MVPQRPTRRHTLHLSVVALIGLAGCATQGSPETAPDGTSTPTATERVYDDGVDDPETRKVENPDGEPAVRSSAHTPSRDDPTQGEAESDSQWRHEYWFVTESVERDALEFSQSTTGVDEASAFVADTDLSETTLLVQQYRVEACTTVSLERLEWTGVGGGAERRIDLRAIYDDPSEDGCATDSPNGSDNKTDDDGMAVRATVARIPVDASRVDGFQYGW